MVNTSTRFSSAKKQIDKLMLSLIPYIILVIIGIPLEQIYQWLKFGEAPERDLFWLFGMMKTDYYTFTDWIGLNKLLSYIFKVHISFLLLAMLFTYAHFKLKDNHDS